MIDDHKAFRGFEQQVNEPADSLAVVDGDGKGHLDENRFRLKKLFNVRGETVSQCGDVL